MAIDVRTPSYDAPTARQESRADFTATFANGTVSGCIEAPVPLE